NGYSPPFNDPFPVNGEDGLNVFEMIATNWCCSDTLIGEVFIGDPVTSTEAILLPEIDVFPNPFNDGLQFELPTSEPALIRIFDGLGKMVFEERQAGTVNLSLGHLPKGIYLLHLETTTGNYAKRITRQ
ncbi:MAG: T9SS type A sorting domain-containing protein, partial [Bacteroidota bacterium]